MFYCLDEKSEGFEECKQVAHEQIREDMEGEDLAHPLPDSHGHGATLYTTWLAPPPPLVAKHFYDSFFTETSQEREQTVDADIPRSVGGSVDPGVSLMC
jgi:hypothetical protein